MTENTWFLLKALILGLVEGVTEFMPVSSTAHLLLIGQWIDFDSGDAKVFEVVVQFGSILAVVWIFRQRLWQLIVGTCRRERTQVAFTRNLIIAFLPLAVIGLLAIQYIKMLFHHPGIFVVTLILGGFIMLWVERKPQFAKFTDSASLPDEQKGNARLPTQALEDISWKQALAVGCAQCLALIPGTSRSGATIIGGMIAGIERKTATEFSFFLAIPTMFAATVYDLYRHGLALSGEQTSAIIVGFVAAFFSALVLVKALLRFVAKHTYRPFAWYRIALGIVVLFWLSLGS